MSQTALNGHNFEQKRICFGVFELDLAAGELRKYGVKIKLQEQPFKVLAILLERPGEVVSREEIQNRIWGAEAVIDFDHSLGRAINKIREALADSADNPRFVETLTRRGYRFIAPVRPAEHASALPAGGQRAEQHPTEAVAAASPVPSRRGRAWLVGAGVLLLAGIGVLALRPWTPQKGPRLLRSFQVTESGRVYPGEIQFESFPSVVTDGSRLYFLEMRNGHVGLVNSSTGDSRTFPVPLPVDIRAPSIADLSSDGSQILLRSRASEIEQPLWAIPELGGAGRRIGNILAHDATWSPDGQSIVYAEGSDLMIAKADGSAPRKLASVPGRAFWLRWSPDGSRLRFTLLDSQTRTMQLWEVGKDGWNAHALFPGWNDPPAECCGNWTPDQKYFVFQSTRDNATDIWVLRESSGAWSGEAKPVRLTAGPLSFLAPTPGRDSRRMYVIGAQVRSEMLMYDKGQRQFVPYLSDIGSVSSLELSRDKQWVTYVSHPGSTLWRSRSDGSRRLQLTSRPMQIYMMRWSPDARQIVFMGRLPGKPWKLYLISAQGGMFTELLPEDRNEADPTWSPDGTMLAFGRLPEYMAEPASTKAIYVLNLKNDKLSVLPNSEGLFSPRWSPDGRYIAAMPLKQDKLVVFDIERQSWTEFADCSTDNPAWSSDGKYIYLRSFSEEGHPLRRIRAADRKMEVVATFQDIRRSDIVDYSFFGLGPGESPIFQVRLSTADIYALDWEAP
jgi:Tol biopolymer transport system component/DNA-binding winged helix-turn-helix (wHTH) protein